MIDADKRKAIYLLHQEGMSLREIARRFHISRNTVRTIIADEGSMPQTIRQDKVEIDPELLRTLHDQCQGRVQRMHEKLIEEEGIDVKYSTLTRMLRELEITGVKGKKKRCHQVPDEPGAEMQHDTTRYRIELAQKPCWVVASLIYLRYSKRRYLKFYRHFNRFKMKCFLHEALMFWGYSARHCIIDNTNLARLRGTGAQAVMVPEMEQFARQYGFEFCCHEIGHANRKAGEERSFWTVETNFLPGRSFQSLEDLNAQALSWATERLENRPQGKAGLIPARAFEHERAFLTKLLPHLPAPYLIHEREIDQYGYASFGGNYYWVPGTDRDEVKLLEYADHLKIYRRRECLVEYPLPVDGVRNEKFSPPGLPRPPHQPRNRRRPTQEEEKRLRAIDPAVDAYLTRVLPGMGFRRHRFLRSLLALSRQLEASLFIQSIERADRYRIQQIATIENIAILILRQASSTGAISCPADTVDAEELNRREAYREGSLTETPDLSIYQSQEEERSEKDQP